MLMVRRNYDALVSGDGACAGCGEKSILKAITSVTEAYMRPVFHAKADRFRAKADELDREGVARLAALKERSPEEYALFRQAIAHLLMGLGGEDDKDTQVRMAAHGPISDKDLIGAMTAVLRQEAFNHKNLQAIDGRLANGMSVMAMAAHTGCNTVYGSTPSNNPHPYPWMNSLFQDGVTVGWLLGESFIVDHGRRSVIPERLADALMHRDENVINAREFYEYVHFSDAVMTDQEILELPKAWVVGGDGGMGDIGYQNTSKVILQNRPNVKALMLDTQVYSNTGGQNSDSTPMLGGNDMNVFGTRDPGQEHREENRGRDVPGRPWLAVHRPGVDCQRTEALQVDSGRARIPRHGVLPVLHDLPAGTWRGRRHGADSGTARSRLARRAGVRVQSEDGRDLPGSARREGQSRRWNRTGMRRSSRRRTSRTATPWRTGAPPKRDSATT